MGLLGGILTGGHSSRMGRDKAEVIIGEKTMLQCVADALTHVADHVVVLGRGYEGYESWPDVTEAEGPIAGIATALTRTRHDRLLAVAVDNALVRRDTLKALAAIGTGFPVVPVDEEGVRQVTCAVYPADLGSLALAEAQAGGSVQSLLDRTSFRPVPPQEWRAWGEDGRSWFSIDTPEALSRGLELLDQG